MAWELKKVEDQRKLLIDAYFQGEFSMMELCTHFKISRKTAYKWLARYKEKGVEGLKDMSTAPLQPFTIYSEADIQLALELKIKHWKWGPKKILAILNRTYPKKDWPSRTRLHAIFKENDMINARRKRGRVPATHPLGNVNNNNDVWSVDFKGCVKANNGEIYEPLTITDGHTRFSILCEHLEKKTSHYVWKALESAFLEYGLPSRVRTDNGPPFGSVGVGRLTKLSINLIKAGILPEWINPGHPEENGRHERFHLTLEQELILPPADSLKDLCMRAARFRQEYNFDRPHESLNMNCPGDFYEKSSRSWDGKLRPPEYDTTQEVRKVGQNGCIWVKQKEYYIGSTLTGENVGLQESEQGMSVRYGPVHLGHLGVDELKKPKLIPKKIVRRG